MSDELTPPGDAEERKLLSTEEINDLPDEDFAYIEDGGEKDASGKTVPRSKRHYPVQDKPHALNALQRAEAQIKNDGPGKEIAEKAMPRILDACHKFGIDVGGNNEAKGRARTQFAGRGVTVNVIGAGGDARQFGPDQIRSLRDEMCGTREERRVTMSQFELREVPNGTGGTSLKFEGYASITCADQSDFNHMYEMEDWLGPYMEGVVRGAFAKTLAGNADVAFNVNHGGVSMARTKPGTLRLFEDLVGLHVDATLNPTRADVQILQAAVADGAIDEMSFAFRVIRQAWSWAEDNGVIDRRWLQEVSLDKGDVSAVNYGANPQTGGLVSMRSAMGALLSGRGITPESWVDAIRELREGKTISAATASTLQPIHDYLTQGSDHALSLADLLGLDASTVQGEEEGAGAAEPSDGEKLGFSLLDLPDYGARAAADLAKARARA